MFVPFLYGSSTNSRRFMAGPLRTTRVNHGGITGAHDATAARYGASTIKLIGPRVPMIVYGLSVIIIVTFGDNIEFYWRYGKYFMKL